MSDQKRLTFKANWQDIDLLVFQLSIEIKQLPEWKSFHIYGIPRGGLVPAVMLSHRLGLPFEKSFMAIRNVPILLVDDINDTGETIVNHYTVLEPRCKQIVPVTLYKKPQSEIKSLFGGTVADDVWVEFPWERTK